MLDRRRLIGALAVAAGLALAGPVAGHADSFRDPASAHRPWFYWWWPGGAVDGHELEREIAEMDAAGFGGATMTWLALGLPDPRDPSVATWGTAQWRARVADALRAARDRGMRLDFTSATSWPFNSPATTPENGLSSQELVYESREIVGPARLDVDAPRPGDAPGASLVAATAARAIDAPGATKPRMLAGDSVVDLTRRVGADGRLRWSVPDGRWIVFGLWRKATGQQPMFGPSAPEPTYAIDHFERHSVEAATRYFDEHVLADPVAPLVRTGGGAVYLDSLEVGAHGLLWTGDLPREFERRRGYSLAPYLPVLFIAGQHEYFEPGTADDPPDFDLTGGAGARARHDYYETLTDLYIEEQLEPMVAWARSHGLSLRAQPAYGTTLDPIRSAAAVPALETETLAHRQPAAGSPAAAYGLDAYRMTASGAHIGAANEVGLELGAVFNGDYTLTLADVKAMIDQAYAGGINQAVLHGYPYRDAPGSAWPSWHPFSSEHLAIGFAEVWSGVQPQWRHMRGLADYIARTNRALQSGEPRVDLAVYRDGFLIADAATPDPPPLFDGGELGRTGFTYDFIDPVSLERRSWPPGARALIVDDEDAMPAAAARRILALARRGLPVVIVGGPPGRGTSLRDSAAEDRDVNAAFDALLRERSVSQVASTGEALGALRALGVEPRVRFNQPAPIRSAQRRSRHSSLFYLWNPGPEAVRVDAAFEARGRPAILDAWSGEVRPVALYRRRGGRTEIPLALRPGETALVRFGGGRKRLHAVATTADKVARDAAGRLVVRDDAGGTRSVTLSDGTRRAVDLPPPPAPLRLDRWRLRVGPVELELDGLRDWRELPALRDAGGVGTYRTTIRLDRAWRRTGGARLDPGAVHGSMRVIVDGVRVSERVVAGAPIEIPARLLRDGRATLEIEVATVLRNRLLGLARAGDPRYARFLAREAAGSGSQPVGLLGPVRLVPYAEVSALRLDR